MARKSMLFVDPIARASVTPPPCVQFCKPGLLLRHSLAFFFFAKPPQYKDATIRIFEKLLALFATNRPMGSHFP
jgi:hypothetical protein